MLPREIWRGRWSRSEPVRRCIIHIGHPKTASTYLQHCLHLSRAAFEAQNYWLPGDFEALGFYNLEVLSRQEKIISGNLAPLHVLLTDGPRERRPAMEAYLFGAPGLNPDCDVLLSSELFFYYWRATAELTRTARRFGLEPEIIAYLPRQDRAAISGYLQNVRFHEFSQGVADFLLHDPNIAYYQYMRVLENLSGAVPETPIRLRTFDSRFMVDGDILADFLTAIGALVNAGDCFRPGTVSNQGLVLEHYELLRAANLRHRGDMIERLRAAETVLGAADRARTFAYYYRPWLEAFLTRSFLPANRLMLDRFMPEAGAAERDYWTRFDPAPEPVQLDYAVMAALEPPVQG